MKTKLNVLLEEKGGRVHQVAPEETVLEAVHLMNERKVGALLVTREGRLEGIFTERDVLCRVVAEGKDPGKTRVKDVMTRQVVVVPPQCTVEEAMEVVTGKRCRHLPVMEGEELLGLISIGDLTRWATRSQKNELESLVRYIRGEDYPG
ncbi:MAG TPA: CBS domain-containing protein [Planctomycetes bacterium]|nr:CBS domain-containing protein [Planctomycetota bacterium]